MGVEMARFSFSIGVRELPVYTSTAVLFRQPYRYAFPGPATHKQSILGSALLTIRECSGSKDQVDDAPRVPCRGRPHRARRFRPGCRSVSTRSSKSGL